ncbi:MAG: amino acid adenylation domain-containing protein [Gemmatimonas sp.]|uniref:amino acid adenylation domain-containing protein n=1 Tax=Gemmatimonas sp. TaxID=1962908 RepID=UPI00391F2ACC|nr:amino acid adenylation domain-containing protein [Gemmatimonadota bacterium]
MSLPSLCRLVVDAAARHAPRPALVGRFGVLSFEELDTAARRWAAALREAGVDPGGRVGIMGNRSRVTYIGALAAAYAGAAFVPLNTRLHPDRLRRIAQLAELDAVIVEPEASDLLASMLDAVPAVRAVLLPESPRGLPASGVPALTAADMPATGAPPCVDPDPSWVAYLLFTSGTTGTPKGVGVTQGNVAAYLANARARFEFTPDDRFSQMFEQSFDVSIFDLFVAWASGACVHTLDARQLVAPASYIEQQQLSVFSSVPSVLTLMQQRRALRPGRFASVRYSMFAGEALPVSLVRQWAAAAPKSVIENQYGPTEATVVVTGFRWSPNDPAAYPLDCVPIGTPFPGVQLRIVDPDGHLVAPGEAGELWIGGAQTVPGYWRDDEQTRRCFTEAEGIDGRRHRHYRSGDLVRMLPGGDIAYLGRVDHQLKILGRRVEPGEVEALARQVAGVSDAVAVGFPLEEGRPVALTLFVQSAAPAETVSAAVAATLSEWLEPFLVPRSVVCCTAFPLNANGKVDRGALLQGLSQGLYPSSSPTPIRTG